MTPENLPAPPTPPHADTCCRRGCVTCIFDYYDRAFSRWEENIRALGLAPEDILAALGQTRATRPRLPSL